MLPFNPQQQPGMTMDETSAFDLKSTLANHLQQSRAKLSKKSLKALVYLWNSSPAGREIVMQVIELRPRMGSTAEKDVFQAIRNMAMVDWMKEIQVNMNK